jgi:Zn-dependent protease with chaperone function
VKGRHAARALVAVALLVGVYVLALGVAALIVGAVVAAVTLAVRSDVAIGALIAKFGLVALITVLAIGRGLWSALRRDRSGPPRGVQLTAVAQPELWSEVMDIAERVGTRPPDEIWLVSGVNAGVSEDSRLLGLKPGTRRLFVGVPLVLAFTRGQLRSVLAHELGHYSGRHTALGPVTYRGAESLARVTEELEPQTLTGRIFAAYARLYHRVSYTVNRQQELEADATSVLIAGPRAAAQALREVHVADAAWDHFVNTHLVRGQPLGLRPTEVFTSFSALLRDPGLQGQLAAVRDRQDWPPAGRYDSHPSLPERLAAIAAQPDAEGPGMEEAALGLLCDADSTLAAVESWMFEGSKLRPTPWSEIAQAVGVEWASSAAGALARAAATVDPDGSLTPGDVLEVLRRGHATVLVEPLLVEEATPEQRRGAAREIVFGYLALALVQQDRARFEVDWDGAWPLVDKAATPIGLLELVERALKREVGPLEHALHRLALDLDRPVDVVAEEEGASRPRLFGALSHLTMRMDYVHLLTLDTGLLLVPLPKRDILTVGLRIALTSDTPTKQVHQLVATDVADLMARPRARLVPWAEVTSATVRKRRGQVRLQLQLSDGTRRKIYTSAVSGVAGEPWRVLAAQLGDRLDWKV